MVGPWLSSCWSWRSSPRPRARKSCELASPRRRQRSPRRCGRRPSPSRVTGSRPRHGLLSPSERAASAARSARRRRGVVRIGPASSSPPTVAGRGLSSRAARCSLAVPSRFRCTSGSTSRTTSRSSRTGPSSSSIAARVLALDPATQRVRIHARTSSSELIAMERLADGTLFVTDFPGDRSCGSTLLGGVDRCARVSLQRISSWTVRLDGVGCIDRRGYRRRTRRCCIRACRAVRDAVPATRHRSPGRTATSSFRTAAVSRIDADTGAISPFANVEALKLVALADGSVLGVEGDPTGGRVVRISADWRRVDDCGNRLARATSRRSGARRTDPSERSAARCRRLHFSSLRSSRFPHSGASTSQTGLISTLVRGRQ